MRRRPSTTAFFDRRMLTLILTCWNCCNQFADTRNTHRVRKKSCQWHRGLVAEEQVVGPLAVYLEVTRMPRCLQEGPWLWMSGRARMR